MSPYAARGVKKGGPLALSESRLAARLPHPGHSTIHNKSLAYDKVHLIIMAPLIPPYLKKSLFHPWLPATFGEGGVFGSSDRVLILTLTVVFVNYPPRWVWKVNGGGSFTFTGSHLTPPSEGPQVLSLGSPLPPKKKQNKPWGCLDGRHVSRLQANWFWETQHWNLAVTNALYSAPTPPCSATSGFWLP